MPRGRAAHEGATYTAQNGYHYTKRDGHFRLTHHLIAEEHLGRALLPSERVKFKNGDRTDLQIDNLEVVTKGETSLEKKRAQLVARRDELDAQIVDLDRRIELKVQQARLAELTNQGS